MPTADQSLNCFPPLEQIVTTLENETARHEFYAQIASLRDQKELKINAFEHRVGAFPKAKTGPFNGLPITVKDQIAVAGWPRWFGLDKVSNSKDKASAPFVQRLQDLGCVVQGKTALPPHALDLQTFNARRGVTENPHKHGFTVGGSSGGGAAAVASGMSVLDIGADLAGSLRLPVSWCGVASLLPTEGRLDTSGMLPKQHRLAHFARMGPIARTAEDLRFFWKVFTGASETLETGQSHRLRVLSLTEHAPIEPQIAGLWAQLSGVLRQTGQTVDADPMADLISGETQRLFGEIMGFETGAMLPFLVRWLLRHDRQAISYSPEFLRHVYQGYRRDHRRHAKNLEQLSLFRLNMLEIFDDCDALVLPVSGIAAFPHIKPIKERSGVRTYGRLFDTLAGPKPYLDALTHYTVPVGLLGWPVITLPFAADHNGLPVGIQLVGKPNEEAKLAVIACALERGISAAALKGAK